MDITGKNGSNTHDIQTNSTGVLLGNNYAAKWQELNLGGNVYSTGMTTTTISNATFTTATLDAACTPIIGVWNPVGSGKNLVILKATLSAVLTALQATGGGTFVWCTSTNNSVITTGITPLNRKTLNASGSVAKGFANTALTGLTTSLSVREASALFGGSNVATAFLQTQAGGLAPVSSSIDEIDGAFIVPQGGVLALLCTTTPVGVSASSSLLWLEIDA